MLVCYRDTLLSGYTHKHTGPAAAAEAAATAATAIAAAMTPGAGLPRRSHACHHEFVEQPRSEPFWASARGDKAQWPIGELFFQTDP
jgi:hypothetical protein